MAEPTRYIPGFNYSGWEADHPTEPKPGAELDNDFAKIRHSIDETIRALRDVRRSDGMLQNGTVGFDALQGAVKAAIAGAEYDYDALEGLDDARAYRAAETVVLSRVPESAQSLRTNGYYAPGDGGGALYRRTDTEPSHPGKLQSEDGSWWELAEEVVLPQMFGAKTDGTDAAEAFEKALAFGKPVLVVGSFTVKRKITATGPTTLRGFDKSMSEIKWTADAASYGIEITPESYHDYIEVTGLGLYTEGTSGNAVSVDWSGLGAENVAYFENKCLIERNEIKGTNTRTQYFENGVVLNFPYSVAVRNNVIMGCWTASSREIEDFPALRGVYVPDQSTRDTVHLKIENNSFYGWLEAMQIYNIEGLTVQGNDVQVCYRGLGIRNTIRKINQYRIFNNHFGTTDFAVRLRNGRHIKFMGNEVSYRFGRETGPVTLLILDGVLDGEVVGNTFRGNGAVNTVHGIILLATDDGHATHNLLIDNNNFRELTNGIVNRVDSAHHIFGPGNAFWEISGQPLVNENGNIAIRTAFMGSGEYEAPGTTHPTLALIAEGRGALYVGRNGADGSAQVFGKDGSVVGVISVDDASTTYGTSSDYRLKSNIRDLTDSGAFIDALRPRRFEMKGREMAGFIAHEFAEVAPSSVSGEKDAVDGNGTPIYQSMQASSSEVMANIIAEIQELRRRVAGLEEGE